MSAAQVAESEYPFHIHWGRATACLTGGREERLVNDVTNTPLNNMSADTSQA
jgi:hypothetical protein